MLNRLPRQMPPLDVMLADIGNPTTREVARALDVTERTVRRWLSHGTAPRPVMLALFWVTSWGLSATDCETSTAVTSTPPTPFGALASGTGL